MSQWLWGMDKKLDVNYLILTSTCSGWSMLCFIPRLKEQEKKQDHRKRKWSTCIVKNQLPPRVMMNTASFSAGSDEAAQVENRRRHKSHHSTHWHFPHRTTATPTHPHINIAISPTIGMREGWTPNEPVSVHDCVLSEFVFVRLD